MRGADTAKRLNQCMRNGWAPVPWGHHPPQVRAAIRAARFRPLIKQCFSNSQKLLLNQHPLTVQFEYVEGIVSIHGIPIQHAWLNMPASAAPRIDITLPNLPEILHSYTVPIEEVQVHIARSQSHGPVRANRLTMLQHATWWRLDAVTASGMTDDQLQQFIQTQQQVLGALSRLAIGERIPGSEPTP